MAAAPLMPQPASEYSEALASSFATTYSSVVAFIAVVHEGSFAKAAAQLGIGRSAVSRSVRKLETQLDSRLFSRTTRSTTLTAEGTLFYEHCRPGVDKIVQAVDVMRELRNGTPRGQLRIAATTGFGRNIVAPLLRGFHAQYPEIALDLMLDDQPADLVNHRIDVAFRNGHLDDSDIIARRLIPMRMLVCASPAYARRHGMPQQVDDLAVHSCVNLRSGTGRIAEWEFKVDGAVRKLVPRSAHCFNDADLALQSVMDGEGVAQLAAYQVSAHLRSGALLACLADHAPDDRGHFLCYASRRHLPLRIRVFIDYMALHIGQLDLRCEAAPAHPQQRWAA